MDRCGYVYVSIDLAVVKFDLENVLRLVVADGCDAGRADVVAFHVDFYRAEQSRRLAPVLVVRT